MLTVIGSRWAGGGSAKRMMHARRIDQAGDNVRREIEIALAEKVHIIPVMLGALPMLRVAELPRTLRPIVKRQATFLRPEQFESDATHLAMELGRILALRTPAAAAR